VTGATRGRKRKAHGRAGAAATADGAGAGKPTQVVAEDRGLRRDVGRLGLLFAGVGSIIGSG
jgi:hypothetical protein